MTKNIIVMGISGAGKSSVLNDLFGTNSATARSANSCTQVTTSFKASLGGEPVTVWDCPGTFDEERTLEEWAREVVSATQGEGFHQIMLVINATMRVGTIDILFITVIRCLLKNFRCDQGITTYFTHCDAAREYYDEETRKKYIAALNKKCKLADLGLPLIDDRKTIAFIPQKIMMEKPEEAKYAIRKTVPESKRRHSSRERSRSRSPPMREAVKAVSTAMQKKSADIMLPAIRSAPVFQPMKITREVGKEVLKQAVHAVGQEAVDEYLPVCFDATTTFVMKWNPDRQYFESVLAVDVRPGDFIQGASLVKDKVLIKNIQKPKHPVQMQKVSIATQDGHVRSMALSLGHFAMVMEKGQTVRIPARSLKVGDLLSVLADEGSIVHLPVTNIETVWVSGTVSLRTRSLTLMVNGIVGSSRSEGDAGILGHCLVLLAESLIPGGGQKLQDLAWMIEEYVSFTSLFRKLSILGSMKVWQAPQNPSWIVQMFFRTKSILRKLSALASFGAVTQMYSKLARNPSHICFSR